MASSYFRLLCFGGLLFSVHVAVAYAADVEPPSGDFRSQFEVRYNAWRKWINEHPTAGSHDSCIEFQSLINLGVAAVPLMIDKMSDDPKAFSLSTAVGQITRKRFQENEWPNGKRGDAIAAAILYKNWWKTQRLETPQRFNLLYENWLRARQSGEIDTAERSAKAVTDLGIDVLPLLLAKISDGDEDSISLVSLLTRGEVKLTDNGQAVQDWWERRHNVWTLPPPETLAVSGPISIKSKETNGKDKPAISSSEILAIAPPSARYNAWVYIGIGVAVVIALGAAWLLLRRRPASG